MQNIKVCKQNTKKEKQRKGLMHIQMETKSKEKTLNEKTEQWQQQNKTKVENKNKNEENMIKFCYYFVTFTCKVCLGVPYTQMLNQMTD